LIGRNISSRCPSPARQEEHAEADGAEARSGPQSLTLTALERR
jgi:hypothetical protein